MRTSIPGVYFAEQRDYRSAQRSNHSRAPFEVPPKTPGLVSRWQGMSPRSGWMRLDGRCQNRERAATLLMSSTVAVTLVLTFDSIHLFALTFMFVVESVPAVPASHGGRVKRPLRGFVEPLLLGSRPIVVNTAVFAFEVDIDVELVGRTIWANVNLLRGVRGNSTRWQATFCDSTFIAATIHNELGRTKSYSTTTRHKERLG